MKLDNTSSALYSVQLAGMSTGVYAFEFHVDDALVTKYENEEIKQLQVEASLELTINPNISEVQIRLEGEVILACDRCLGDYVFPIHLKESAIVKQGSKNPDIEINIIIFEAEKGIIEFDQYIYDMIVTALPMQRVHEDEDDCDQDMIKRIEENRDRNEGIDPRWNDLQNLIKNN